MKTGKNSGRFSGPSDVINIRKLERENRKFMFFGIFLSVLFYTMLGTYFFYKKVDEKVTRPILIELHIIKPQMTRPFIIIQRNLRKEYRYRKESHILTPSKEILTKTPSTLETGEPDFPMNIDQSLAWGYSSETLSDSLDYLARIIHKKRQCINQHIVLLYC